MQRAAKKRSVFRRLVQAVRRENGTATIEFVILFPAIMTIFLSSFEVSIYLARSVMLDRGIDLAVRTLRLGRLQPATQEELRRQVCEGALIFENCIDNMMIELTRVRTDIWDLPATNVTCVDRDAEIAPKLEGEDTEEEDVNFELGAGSDLMIVRACAVMDPFFGTTPLVLNLPLDTSGGYQVISSSTFVNEP